MSKIILIGDVHGKTSQYQNLIEAKYADQRTIQIGDMGLGFKGVGLPMPGYSPLDWSLHKFIRGNHDSPMKCRAHKGYLGDYGFLEKDNLFYVSGAFSIDRMRRVEDISWWAHEELTRPEMDNMVNLYLEKKPRFVVAHECPSSASVWLLTTLLAGFRPEKLVSSRTGEAMEYMFEQHKPEKWIFGHYHVNKTFDWRDTEFTCVNELSTFELDTAEKSGD